MFELDKKEVVSLEKITEAYFSCRRRKRTKGTAIEYEQSYELNNYNLWKDLNNMTYEIGTSTCFCVTRPKLREVFAANFRDRIVHHLVINEFNDIFENEMIDSSYNCRVGKGVIYGVDDIEKKIKKHSTNYTQDCWILKCDIEGFFMSIDKDILYKTIEDIILKNYKKDNIEWWLWLIKKIIYHRPELDSVKHGDLNLWGKLPKNKSLFTSNGKGLPIGNLTSQIFGNLYLSHFDSWLLKILENKGGYGRYVDDFIIIHNSKNFLLRLLPKIRFFMKEKLKIKLHRRKIYLQHATKGVSFLGTTIKPYRKYTNNQTIKNIYNIIVTFNKKRKRDCKRFIRRINSYFGFLVHNNTYAIRYNLWNKIKDKKYFIVMKDIKYLKIKK